MERNEKGKCFAYIRVSSLDQNIASQEEMLKKSNYQIDEIFRDQLSGKNLERPSYQEMIKRLRNGDWVVVAALDRLGRNLRDLYSTLSFFEERNIRLISLKENVDFSTSIGKMFFGFSSIFAEYELNVIRERQQIGIKRAKAEGKYKGRKPVAMPENFDSCFVKYMESNREKKYTMKTFGKETGLKISTLEKFIKKKKEELNKKLLEANSLKLQELKKLEELKEKKKK